MAFIQHPNVARVYDRWEDDDSAWVAMELVPGESLREDLAERGTLSVYGVEPILAQTAAALASSRCMTCRAPASVPPTAGMPPW